MNKGVLGLIISRLSFMNDKEKKFYFEFLRSYFGDIGEPMDDEEESMLYYQEQEEIKRYILH